MSDQTSGPWHINDGSNYYDERHRICNKDGDSIAIICNDEDANLIAAAPDLLEACEAALGCDTEMEGVDSNLPKWLKEQLQAAIKKARVE
jgi:hypothetical protein